MSGDKNSHVVTKFRFLEYGKEPPKNSRMKGTITTETMIGWYAYTSRKEATNESNQRVQSDSGFLGYTSRNGFKTYTHQGWLKNAKETKEFKKIVAEAFCKNGDIAWDTVVSMRSYTDSFASGMYNANDYAAIVEKLLPEFFKKAGFVPSNMIWWMNYHDNKHNPHMHIVFMEKSKLRTKGKLNKRMIEIYQNLFLREFGLRAEFKKRNNIDSKDFFKQLDNEREAIINAAKLKNNETTHIVELNKILPRTGKMAYNSRNIAPYKKQIDSYITSLLKNPEVSILYDVWLSNLDKLVSLNNEMAGQNISHLKEQEMFKLYTRIGNAILNEVKAYRKGLNMSSNNTIDNSNKVDGHSTVASSGYNQTNKNNTANSQKTNPKKPMHKRNVLTDAGMRKIASRIIAMENNEKERDLEMFLRNITEESLEIV